MNSYKNVASHLGLFCFIKKKKKKKFSKNWSGPVHLIRIGKSTGLMWLPIPYEPRCEKTGLPGFRPGPTQTGLCSHRRWLEA